MYLINLQTTYVLYFSKHNLARNLNQFARYAVMWWTNNNSAKEIVHVYSTVNFTDSHFHNMFSTVDKNNGFFVCLT